MATTEAQLREQLATYIERSKKIELLRNSSKYESEKDKIERLDLNCYINIYNTIAATFNMKREVLLARKAEYERLLSENQEITKELNGTIMKINANPRAYPVVKQADPAVVSSYKLKTEELTQKNESVKNLIDHLPKKYVPLNQKIHEAFFTNVEYMESMIHPLRRRTNSLTKVVSMPTDKEVSQNRLRYIKDHVDDAFRGFMQIHQDVKIDSKYSKPPMRASLSQHKEGHTVTLDHIVTATAPEFKPSEVKSGVYVAEPTVQKRLWGYIPAKGPKEFKTTLVTQKYTVKEGTKDAVLFHPYCSWLQYMKNAKTYVGYDSVSGVVVLCVAELAADSPCPPDVLSRSKEMVMCTIKSKRGEERMVMARNMFLTKEQLDIQKIVRMLDPVVADVKFKTIENKEKLPLLYAFDQINTPAVFEVPVSYATLNSRQEVIIEHNIYPDSLDSFMNTFSSAVSVHEETSVVGTTSKFKYTNYFFFNQNDWCEVAYYVDPLIGRGDKGQLSSHPPVSLIYAEGVAELPLDALANGDICIVVHREGHGYSVEVAQKGMECNIGNIVPQHGYIIYDDQMHDFMSGLIVECFRCYRDFTCQKPKFVEEREKVLVKFKKMK